MTKPTEREAEVYRLHARALAAMVTSNLTELHERLDDKLADLHGIRDQRAEHARFVRQVALNLETAKLDALAEMESQPNYVPGKNEEQRRRQRDSWLANHPRYLVYQNHLLDEEASQEQLELEEHRVQGELHSIKSLIAIRTTELNLIASFVGR
jgi:hypothetical protein